MHTLFNRTRRLCTTDTIDKAEAQLRQVLKNNSYPEAFIDYHSRETTSKVLVPTVPKKSVFLKLPFKGDNVNALLKKRIATAISRAYNTATVKLINHSDKIGAQNIKDRVSDCCKSKCIYLFECSCGCRYIGRTNRTLQQRIKEHIPNWLINNKDCQPLSAVTKHLYESKHQADASNFKILNQQGTESLLRLAEASLIRRYSPDLCVQKEHVTHLALPWS